MALHCVYLDPAAAATPGFTEWLETGDAVLLLGPASTLAREGHAQLSTWTECGATVHVLRDELALHGIEAVDPCVVIIDYPGWVELAATQPLQLSWD